MEKLSLHSKGKKDHIANLRAEQKQALEQLNLKSDLDEITREKMKTEIIQKYKKLIQDANSNLY